MTADIFKRLEGLESTAKALNEESDGINDLIKEIAARLEKLNLGVTAEVQISSRESLKTWDGAEEPIRVECSCWLIYSKGFKWQERTYECQDHQYDEWLLMEMSGARNLLDAPRQVRIDALDAMEGLIDELEKAAKANIEKIRKAKDALK